MTTHRRPFAAGGKWWTWPSSGSSWCAWPGSRSWSRSWSRPWGQARSGG